jgi:O-antigen ligase
MEPWKFLDWLKQNEEDIYLWLCIGIVYTMVFWTAGNSVLTIVLSVFWIFVSQKKFDYSSRRTKLMLVFVSLYIVSVVGMLYTANVGEGLFRLQQKSALLAFPIVFSTIRLSAEKFTKVSFHFILAVLISCIVSLSTGMVKYWKTGIADALNKEQLMVFPDMNPPVTGLFCLLAIVFLLSPRYRPPVSGVVRIVAVALISGFVMLLSVRLIAFCLLMVLLIFAFIYIKSTVSRVGFVLALMVFTAISIFSIPTLNRQWKELVDVSGESKIALDQDSSLGRAWGGKSIRLALWTCSLDIIERNWLFGVGTGDVQDSLQASYEKRKFYFASQYNRYNAHNQSIELWIGNGLPGVFLFILCMALPVAWFYKKSAALEYFLFLALAFTISMTETLLNVNKGIIWYSFFNSIFAFIYLNPDAVPARTNKSL